jgi:hypothetical protein
MPVIPGISIGDDDRRSDAAIGDEAQCLPAVRGDGDVHAG